MLKNSQFSVGYDLPKEINEARKRLWEETKYIKSKQPRSKCQIVYPAKLIVDGKVYRDEFPQWNDAVRGNRLIDFTHIDKNDPIFEQTSLSPSYTVTILGHGRATTHPDLSNRDASA